MPYMELLPYTLRRRQPHVSEPYLQLVNGVSIQASPKSFIELRLRQILTWRRPSTKGSVNQHWPCFLGIRSSRIWRIYKGYGVQLGNNLSI